MNGNHILTRSIYPFKCQHEVAVMCRAAGFRLSVLLLLLTRPPLGAVLLLTARHQLPFVQKSLAVALWSCDTNCGAVAQHSFNQQKLPLTWKSKGNAITVVLASALSLFGKLIYKQLTKLFSRRQPGSPGLIKNLQTCHHSGQSNVISKVP